MPQNESTAAPSPRCYGIGPGERLERKELGRGRGIVVRSAAAVTEASAAADSAGGGQQSKWRESMRRKMRLKIAQRRGRLRIPEAKSLKMEKLNEPLLDVAADVASPSNRSLLGEYRVASQTLLGM